LEPRTIETGGSVLPTPTAAANQESPSFLKWSSFRNLMGHSIPTPTVMDAAFHGKMRTMAKESIQKGGFRGVDLATFVQMYPTPTTQDAHNNGGPSQMKRNRPSLNSKVGGALNPEWVEWLMGWRIGSTAFEPAGTE
jgi:hypothetical protein